MSKWIDLTGQKFGRLTVLGMSTERTHNGQIQWNCQCECGNRIQVISAPLNRLSTRSCGCLRKDLMTTHGGSRTEEYVNWCAMISRCTNSNHRSYDRYGGDGVTVCDRWLNSFEAFLSDMGSKPGPSFSLDRYPDPNGSYEPGNVRWATPEEQNNNRSNTIFYHYNGRSWPVAELARELNADLGLFRDRLERGWSVKEAAFTPAYRKKLSGA